MRLLLAAASLVATAAPARADVSETRGGFGADVVGYHGTNGALFGEDDPENRGTGGAFISAVTGDGRGADVEVRFATQIIASIFELRARVYLADDVFYLYSGGGCGFLLVIPTDLVATAGVGVAFGDRHFELELGGILAYGGTLGDHLAGRAARASIGVRF